MVLVQNPDVVSAIKSQTGLVGTDYPQNLANQIVMVIDGTPRNHRVINLIKNASSTTTGTTVIHTTDSKALTYISGFLMSAQYDATCDATSINLQCTVGGQAKVIMDFARLTTTAYQDSVFVALNTPILVDKGTAINLTHTFTVGAGRLKAVILGYEVIQA